VSSVDDLILDLLEWLGTEPRPYSEVLDAWRTSCPRLPVWEEANERGFVVRQKVPGEAAFVTVTSRGIGHLKSCRARRVLGNESAPAGGRSLLHDVPSIALDDSLV
jgi:hypothetical protein